MGARERLVLATLRLALLLLAVSVLSNLVGSMSLAEVLVAMPVRIIYTAALVFAGAQLLTTLIVVALRSHRDDGYAPRESTASYSHRVAAP